ncbi:hypothetical protein EUX98_g3175 [Antrodiella citrinella]|uniref:Adenine DNA glycosylase n=1 Tax=Antrodiella citrinella TaxID=2447956 RepID=A0A4S4N5C6_9APHY|nr:hypothetical protein EUX98_g3175 [Antrodiella citrinella]
MKRKLSVSSEEWDGSDSDPDDAYKPKAVAGSSRAPLGSSTKNKKARAPPKKPGSKKGGKSKKDVDNASEDDVEEGRDVPHAASMHTVTHAKDTRKALLAWYDTIHEVRGMPWRKPFNDSWNEEERAQRAYEVWISEIMLQQTQVVTVIPYYNKWMSKFPTIEDLAESDIDTVNSLWKGLGYYSRAARILQGAQKAVKELGGRLPDNAIDMESKIPGIGRYSAGAICSIAYNQCVPVVDGNVNRLLSRFLAFYTPPKAKQALDVLWAGAAAMVEGADRPGDTNQALIELGATVCKVHDPLCDTCPVQQWCRAHARQRANEEVQPEAHASSSEQQLPDIEDLCTLCRPLPVPTLVTLYPMKVERKKAREELDVVSVIEWRAAVDEEDRWFLLVRRPQGGLLAGLHEFPTIPDVSVATPDSMTDFAQSSLRQLLVHPPPPPSPAVRSPTRHSDIQASIPEDNPRIVKAKPAGDVLHIFSHIKKTYRVQWVLLVGGSGGRGEEERVIAGQYSVSGDPPPAALPPTLHTSPHPYAKGHAAKRTGIAKSKEGTALAVKKKKLIAADSVQGSSTRLEAMWVRMDDVPKANIGTGVLKVWKQVRTLWDSEFE